MKPFSVFPCLLLKVFAVLVLASFLLSDVYKMKFSEQGLGLAKDFEIFLNDWCRLRELRTNVDVAVGPCKDQMKWDSKKPGRVPTNANQSFIASWNLKPAGEFSRFFIQAVSSAGQLKSTGGDWWRVLIRGTASMNPAVFDLGNGTYEVMFLPVEPGTYDVEIVLDYTLCDGFRDPPDDWFVIGNSQGKMQPDGVLNGHANKDYRLQPLHGGKSLMFNIGLPSTKGLYIFNVLPKKLLSNLRLDLELRCGMKCNVIWDGYGRWSGEIWKPYLKAKRHGTNVVNKSESSSYNTLWIYGDSQARRMYNEVINTTLCRSIFKSCKLSMNWVYAYEGEHPSQDDLDFDHKKITNDIKNVLERPEMSENSVMVLNLGLHYLQSTNFSNYVKLLRGVVGLFKGSATMERQSVRMIWKTSTPVSKEKDVEEFIYSERKRFINNPRVAMFNAYATSLMCREGFEVLDVHPLTSSYPHGTGGPNVEHYKEHDIVHFEPQVMAPFQEALVEYFTGNLPEKLSMENYEFS